MAAGVTRWRRRLSVRAGLERIVPAAHGADGLFGVACATVVSCITVGEQGNSGIPVAERRL